MKTKTTLRAASAVVALALAAPAVAQQAAAHPRFGAGLSINPNLPLSLVGAATISSTFTTPKLYVPFYIAPNIRIEPEIGYFSISNDTDSTNNHVFDLGIGALYLKQMTPSTNLYGGLRLASIWAQTETRLSPTTVERINQRNTLLAFVAGTEYLPVQWFSVGIEGQLAFTWLGDEDINIGGATSTGRGGFASAIQGLIFLRVYFL